MDLLQGPAKAILKKLKIVVLANFLVLVFFISRTNLMLYIYMYTSHVISMLSVCIGYWLATPHIVMATLNIYYIMHYIQGIHRTYILLVPWSFKSFLCLTICIILCWKRHSECTFGVQNAHLECTVHIWRAQCTLEAIELFRYSTETFIFLACCLFIFLL